MKATEHGRDTLLLAEMRDVEKRRGARGDTVLRVPSFRLERGASVVLTGRSGSGKTTLLHLLAGLLAADAGTIVVNGCTVSALSEAERDGFRARTVGCIFQTLNLLQELTALENVLLATRFAAVGGAGTQRPAPTAGERATELLVRLGLERRLHSRAGRLSLGEQQRVAIARALVNTPALLLADEPTASLDDDSARTAVDELQRLAHDTGAALLIATHDPVVTAAFDRVVPLAEIAIVEHRKTS